MKRTLITIALTTVVVLTLVGVVTGLFAAGSGGAYRSLDSGGYGGGQGFVEPSMEMPAAQPMPTAGASYAPDRAAGYDYNYEEVVSNVATERLVIQNVDMSIVVPDPKARMDEIANMAVEMGGFVVSSNLYRSTYGPNNIEVPEGSITIRVPSKQLDEALEKIKKDVVEVTYENRSGEDVTSQYVDLQSRLKAKQAAEKKLLEFLEAATDTEDALAVYVQLQQIQSEIEVLKGQIKYYEESAALSAVSIRLVAEETVKPIEIGGWKLQGTANDAVQDLIRFTQSFTRFLIRFILSYLPAMIMIAIPLYGVFVGGRALFRRFRKTKVEVKEKEEKK
ncbi:MAG TPA: DUF4349 domain-containing protein [Anaerolineales bacterium]|nr:DUF4349 domain-containing protein [Anaerolineales bacterium]